MKKLLLLAVEKVDDDKYYLYVMEMVYQKIFRVFKSDSPDKLSDNWRVGYITEVEKITKWSIDEESFITSKDTLKGCCDEFHRILFDKASCSERILSLLSGKTYGVIGLKQLEIDYEEQKIEFEVWGTKYKRSAKICDPYWLRFWKSSKTLDVKLRWERKLSSSKTKLFGVVENYNSNITIKKLFVV